MLCYYHQVGKESNDRLKQVGARPLININIKGEIMNKSKIATYDYQVKNFLNQLIKVFYDEGFFSIVDLYNKAKSDPAINPFNLQCDRVHPKNNNLYFFINYEEHEFVIKVLPTDLIISRDGVICKHVEKKVSFLLDNDYL